MTSKGKLPHIGGWKRGSYKLITEEELAEARALTKKRAEDKARFQKIWDEYLRKTRGY